MMTESAENLIKALHAGDEEAYEQLYDLYYEQLYALSYGILQNHSDAQDAVQQTFIRVFQKLSTLKNDRSFHLWLMKVATNETLKILNKRKPEASLEEYDETPAESGDEEPALPEAVLEQHEDADRLHRIISGLSAQQRQTLVLFYFDGMKIREIAEVMGCSENTVKTRLYYARSHIKNEWEKQERGKEKRLNGAMLPFGEIFVRFLRGKTENKRRRKRIRRKIRAFLRHKDDPGYVAAAQAENLHALRVAAGAAAGFIAVVLASATVADITAESDEIRWIYAPSVQERRQEETQDKAEETVYLAPEYIAENRVNTGYNSFNDFNDRYDAAPEVPYEEPQGLNYRGVNVQVPATQPSTQPPTEPATRPPVQPPTQPLTRQLTRIPAAQPAEQTILEQMLAVINGRYEGDVEVSGGLLYAYDNVDDKPLDPIRFISAELLNDGIYRFELEYRDHFSGQYGYYYPAGTPLSDFPSDLTEQMRYMGYRSYGVSYSDGAYRLQKDALLFVEPSQYGTYYGHHLRSSQ